MLEIDTDSEWATIQAGTLGPAIERQLGEQGWTLGHFGDIADITRGLRVVMPGKVLVVRPLPDTSTGPSVREMILGSEGRLGVITEVTVQVHRIPGKRLIFGYLFPSWDAGLTAMQEISTSGAHPSITRVSDGRQTSFSFALARKRPEYRFRRW